MTFAYKVVKKKTDTGTTPADAAPSSEEAALFDVLEQSNTDMGHFMTENKFQNFRMAGYIKSKISISLLGLAVKNSTEQSLYTSIFEIVFMVGLGAFQVYYLKKVLDNKRMI